MRRIGLMGGSFNPIHFGHVNLARAALESGAVDEALFLPTGNPPHKHEGLADKMDRLAMAQLAVEGEAHMSVSREEIDRQGVIYTVDTLTRLRAQMPGCTFHYLIGADTLRQLHTWRRADDVIHLCAFLVVMRPGEDDAKTDALLAHWREKGARMRVLKAEPMDISSTEIRSRAAQGLPLSGLVPDGVADYIRAHGLYGGCEG